MYYIKTGLKHPNPHPLLLVLCVCKQLPDVGLGLPDVFVEDLGAVDDLRLPGFEHLADLSSHQGFTAARGSEKQDPLHMLTAWRQTQELVLNFYSSKCFFFPLVVVHAINN